MLESFALVSFHGSVVNSSENCLLHFAVTRSLVSELSSSKIPVAFNSDSDSVVVTHTLFPVALDLMAAKRAGLVTLSSS